MIYREYDFGLQREDLSSDDINHICNLLNIKIEYNLFWEKLKVQDYYYLNNLSILVYHSESDNESFIFIDGKYIPDSLDVIIIGVRCNESISIEVEQLLHKWHDKYWSSKDDCMLTELQNQDLRNRAYDFNNDNLMILYRNCPWVFKKIPDGFNQPIEHI